MSRKSARNLLAIIGPGMLVAATGVGAGDLATASLAGNKLGMAVLWAVVLGAGLKYVLTEGLARWQLATGETLLEGCMTHLGRPFMVCFLLYLLPWSFFVGAALMSACGGAMFVTVLATAVLIRPDWGSVLSGLVMPGIPQLNGGGLEWTVGLMGGVGGTLTVLCYGYWIREEGRKGTQALRTCRLDLASGYLMTALWFSFKQVQKIYAVYGALFIPFLAVVLLYLNGRSALVGRANRNRPFTTAVLIATLVLTALAAAFEIKTKLG